MKLTESITNHILIKAGTNSEWDCCDYALVRIDENIMENFIRWNKLADMLKSENSFSELSFAYTSEFLQSDKEILSQDNMWSYVQIDKTDNIQCVENKLIAHHLNFALAEVSISRR